jgi:multiple sugar transport system substrate-binding protein
MTLRIRATVSERRTSRRRLMTHPKKRSRLLVAMLLALALVAASCGDNGSDEPAAQPPPPPPAEEPAPPPAEEPAPPPPAAEEPPPPAEEPPPPAEEPPPPPAEEEPEPVELRLVIWDERQLETHQLLVETFREDYPHISIEVEVIPADYWTVVKTQIAGGDPPDIMWINVPDYPDLALNDALLPITDLVERDDVDLSPFPEALVDSYTIDGELYGISKDFDTVGLFYRVDLFDAAGLDYPDETWTWDDLKAAAAALTSDDVWGYAGGLSIQEFELNLVRQNGGELVTPDGTRTLFGEPAACEALEFLYSFHTDGTAPDQVTQDASHHWGLFAAGRIAMMQDGSWAARGYADSEFDIDVAPLPAGKQRGNTIHGLSWAILSGTEHPEQAWEFLKFLATEEAHRIQAETGSVIPSYAGMQQVWLDGFGDEMNVQVLLDEVAVAKPFPVAVAPVLWYWEAARSVLQDALRGNIPFPEACSAAAEAADRYIADNRFTG